MKRLINTWNEDQYMEILDLWSGKSLDLNPIENLWSILKGQVDMQKSTTCDQLSLTKQEWLTIC